MCQTIMMSTIIIKHICQGRSARMYSIHLLIRDKKVASFLTKFNAVSPIDTFNTVATSRPRVKI